MRWPPDFGTYAAHGNASRRREGARGSLQCAPGRDPRPDVARTDAASVRPPLGSAHPILE